MIPDSIDPRRRQPDPGMMGGFTPDIILTADVHENRAMEYYPDLTKAADLIESRATDLGQYHFTRWTKTHTPNQLRPSWLYRSLPDAPHRPYYPVRFQTCTHGVIALPPELHYISQLLQGGIM